MQKKIVAFIPIKMSSQRLPRKNILPLGGKPLCCHLFDTLVEVKGIDEKYVFCSDENIKKYMPIGLMFLKRNSELDGDNVRGLEIIESFINAIDADIYILTHVTSPFMKRESFEKAINIILKGGYDSVFSAKKLQGYCWYQSKPINYNPDDIVQTQYLEPLYIETGGFFIFKKEVFTKLGRRIGSNPYIYATDEFENIDIDTKDDFLLAETVADHIKGE